MPLLSPQSIAVIGASADPKKVGHLIFRNLVTQGFKGDVFPVNPKGGDILGKPSFISIAEIKKSVDVAVIVTPASTVCGLAEECGKKGVKLLVVISAGFSEAGEAGKTLESDLVAIAQKYKMKLVGPNCLGLIRPKIGMNASFAPHIPAAGGVALLSQSGAIGDAFIDRSESIGLKLSLFVSLGNKAMMDECDFLEIAGEDKETTVIGLYLENIRDGQRFLKLARRIGCQKPIIILKSGTSEGGRRAVSSHTGALAGSDAAVGAIVSQAGLRRASTTEEFLDLLRTLSSQPVLPSDRIAIITNAGGPGVLATDAAEHAGLTLPPLSAKQESILKAALPPSASTKNPIDVLGDALADRYVSALKAVDADPNIDGAVVVLTPQIMTPALEIAKAIVQTRKRSSLLPVVTCFMGETGVREAIAYLHSNGIPNFPSPETAVQMLGELRFKNEHVCRVQRAVKLDSERTGKALAILQGAEKGLLSEQRTNRLLKLYHMPIPHAEVVATPADAIKIAATIGYPVTAKISSKDILHKTDIGGVRVNLKNEDQLRTACEEILVNVKKHAPTAHISGLLIQQSLPPGSEFIAGALADPSVGHLVMAGLGGIYTELFKDAVFRVAPVSVPDVYLMLPELKSWKLLLGMRGKAQLAIDAYAELISNLSLLVSECPEISEVDFNPVLVTEKGITILDAKVVVG